MGKEINLYRNMKPVDLTKLSNYVDFGYFKPTVSRKSINRSIKDRIKAWELDYDYYDGERSFGYGGFYDDGRWLKLLPNLLDLCDVNSKSIFDTQILDLSLIHI